MPWLREARGGVVVSLHIQPRASRNEIVGVQGESLKVRLTAPPVDGAANKMCLAFLAQCLDLPKSSLEIVAGATGRSKQVFVPGDPDSVRAALEKGLKQSGNKKP